MTRYTRDRTRPAQVKWDLIREALQSSGADLPELLWYPETGWVIAWP